MRPTLPVTLMGTAVLALAVSGLNAAPPASAPAAQSRAQSVTSGELAQMQARMKLMQEQMASIQRATDPNERQKLLVEHMQTMIAQMQAMRALGGGMMSGAMGAGAMGGGMMRRGMRANGAMGGGMMAGPARGGTAAERRQWMQDRLDMMQLMMEQMIGQMRAMQGMMIQRSSK